jgi:hypothetical protein
MDFFLVWSTAPATFQPRFMRSVESICFHHPDARVSVLSNTLPDNFFEALVAAGLNVRVERYDLRALVAGTRAEVWYDFRRFWNQSVYYPNHEADLLRLLRLEQQGGVYVDTDVVFVRPLPGGSSASALGIESGSGGLPWEALVDGSSSSAAAAASPALLPPDAVLCNAVMAFGAGAPFVRRAVEAFVSEYVPYTPGLSFAQLLAKGEWGAMGPWLLTRAARAAPAAVRVLRREAFYAVAPGAVAEHMGAWREERDAPVWATIARDAVAVHYWNQLSSRVDLACGSLLHRLLEANCVVCTPLPCTSGPRARSV